jgi:DNA polymerase-1
MPRKYVLLDAHSIIFRSYFAFIKNPLKNSRGETTSGIFGFLNTLEKIKAKFDTEYIALAFDTPAETFRDKVFKEYKATRPAPPPDIPFQIIKTKEVAGFLGIPAFELDGFEADDVLATLAVQLKKLGEVYIVTSDKDLLQLVGGNVYVYDAYGDMIFTRDKVLEKFGVPPEQIPDYLALVGDSIDNVPGVPGIGPKRAMEILNKYDSLETALEKDPRLTGHRDKARLSKKLILLEHQVPIKFSDQDLRLKKPDYDRLLPVLLDLEFHSYIRGLGLPAGRDQATREIDADKIKIQDYVGVGQDGERIFVANGDEVVYTVPLKATGRLTEAATVVKAGYDLKSIVKIMTINPPLFDIGVAVWLIDPTRKTYALEDIALNFLNRYIRATPPSIAQAAYDLYPILRKRLQELGESDLYRTIEEPLITVLARMEQRGIRIDIPYLKNLGAGLEKELTGIEANIYRLAGRQFNINSPKQLAQVLFDELKLAPGKRRKTHFSTDVEVLQQLSARHPLPAELLRYRELKKITSTYVEPLIDLARAGRVHTTYNQTATSTGRLSSSNPNLQNIPIRKDLGKKIRRAFVAEKGFCLISADYSQIELRILAHITRDQTLRQAFAVGDDIHRHTASLVFNIPEEKVDDNQRRMAKVVNYGLIYGMSDYGLAQGLDIPREEALAFVEKYYALYPEVTAWREAVVVQAEEKGYTETIYGRKRPVPELGSDNFNVREAAKRVAINTPIQGTAADLIKLAMIRAEEKLTAAGFKSGLILSVHDELLFEIEESRIEVARDMIKDSMERAGQFDVPIEVTIGIGSNWTEAH